MVLLLLSVLLLGHIALADGTVELPANAKFITLKVKSGEHYWKSIDVPRINKRMVTLPAGEYSYSVSIKSASGKFRGTLTVTDGSHQYIHRAISPDRQSVYSWVSTASPRSEAYETESRERFCMGVLDYGSDKPQYMLDACAELVENENPRGLYATGHMYDEGKGGLQQDRGKASEYYKRAYELGFEEAGIAYFLLHQRQPNGIAVLLDVASRGNVWAIGVAGQVLAASDDPEERAKSREFAEKSLRMQDPTGFKTLAQLALRKEHEGVENVIDAAALFNLYNINNLEFSSNARRFKSLIEEALVSGDAPAISAKTTELSDEYVDSGLFFMIDTSVLQSFEDRGELSVVVNNQFTMRPAGFDERYFVELLPNERHHRATVLANGAYVAETTFLLGETGASVHCLALDSELGSLQVTTHLEDEQCPETVDGAASMWKLLNQYQ